MLKVDYRVDAHLGDKASLAALVRVAALNSATLIHYRDETSSTREMIEQTRAVGAALAVTGVPFVVNDRVDVALAAGAGGVHLGRITAQRAAEVVAAGADGVAVISTIFAAVKPAAATYELRACVDKALREASR